MKLPVDIIAQLILGQLTRNKVPREQAEPAALESARQVVSAYDAVQDARASALENRVKNCEGAIAALAREVGK